MVELFERGGTMMYPLVLASFIMIAIVIERLIALRKRKIIIPEIVAVVEQFRQEKDVELASNICQKYSGPLPNIISLSLENRTMPRQEIREFVEDEGRQQIRRLEKNLGILETIAAVAPLLGLLGTVIGMIKVFSVIKEQGIGQAAALSGGISEALVTTVAGLFIGIPALIFYNYFLHKAEGFTLDIEKYSNRLLQKIHSLNNGGETNRASA